MVEFTLLSLKDTEKALTLNIERLLLVLPCKFRFEAERDEYTRKIQTLESQVLELTKAQEEHTVAMETLQQEFSRVQAELDRRLAETRELMVLPQFLTTKGRSPA